MKSSFSKSKCFIWLGLISGVLGLGTLLFIPMSLGYIILYLSIGLGITTYFSIVLCRTYKKTGNINLGKIVLISSIVIYSIISILSITQSSNISIFTTINTAISIIYYLILDLYLLNLFYGKGIKINNKLLLVVFIVYILSQLVFLIKISGITILNNLQLLLIMPYFYHYYNLVKGVKTNG